MAFHFVLQSFEFYLSSLQHPNDSKLCVLSHQIYPLIPVLTTLRHALLSGQHYAVAFQLSVLYTTAGVLFKIHVLLPLPELSVIPHFTQAVIQISLHGLFYF